MDKRTPELKMLELMNEQTENLKTAYDNFTSGKTNLQQAGLHVEQIGIALTEQSRAILKEKKHETDR